MVKIAFELDDHMRRAIAQGISAPRWSWSLPTIADVDRFRVLTGQDRALRLMVLNDLRSRSASRTGIVTFASIMIAVIVVFATVGFTFAVHPEVINHFRWAVFAEFMWAATWVAAAVLVLIGALTLWAVNAGRYSVWLRAFEEAVHAEEQAVE